jgi:hypothetical protein
MSEYVYTTVPGKIKALLAKIKDVGVPQKVTVAWLKTIGFTSSNDSSLIGVLKFIAFIDQSQVPTDQWRRYRGSDGRAILGEAIKKGYSDLFAIYPDAQNRSTTELDNIFSTSSKGGKEVIKKLVGTFKALVAEAEFHDESKQNELHVEAGPLHAPLADQKQINSVHTPGTPPSLHIDMQVHISPDATAEQIDQIFSSMAKHLYGQKS